MVLKESRNSLLNQVVIPEYPGQESSDSAGSPINTFGDDGNVTWKMNMKYAPKGRLCHPIGQINHTGNLGQRSQSVQDMPTGILGHGSKTLRFGSVFHF
jgi:hypothetical protein